MPVCWCDDVDNAAAAGSYRYLGCFKDVNDINRDLKGRDLILTGLTTDACAGQCQPVGFAYFGLQLGKRCLCGVDYGSHGPSVGQLLICLNYCGKCLGVKFVSISHIFVYYWPA